MKLIGLSPTQHKGSTRAKKLLRFLVSTRLEHEVLFPESPVKQNPEFNSFPDLRLSKDTLYVMYGYHGVSGILREMMSQKIDFLFIDNGYTTTRQRVFNHTFAKEETTFSITVNNTRLNYITDSDTKSQYLPYVKRKHRSKKLRKKGGDYILLCVPSPFVAKAHGFLVDEWIEKARWNLRKLDKEIILRRKSEVATGPLFKDLVEYACLTVTSQSLTGLESIAAGVPVISDPFSLSAPVSNPIDKEYEHIDELGFPNESRFRQWVASLMSNEMTLRKRASLEHTLVFRKIMELQKKSFHNFEISDIQGNASC